MAKVAEVESSGPPKLKGGVQELELDPGVAGGGAPVNAAAGVVAVGDPGGDLAFKGCA
jgi:hypothetical protein